ncbi:MAG: hypothetical protein CL944_00710 [Candidatus Diapherotrites archaeon]|uniref:Uncharacterized protein n=1 Tax=Candidatus Iainarchaeum sp. TaxID=3101447 RepID=A0A2D6LP42_9ARCH|nr:hypothetical protein [Candidatus Diapherotrites archaeon]|tara:strand:- start:1712 stop:2230 length:519 start_codon:yes stop_codon:yes gene_type:complete
MGKFKKLIFLIIFIGLVYFGAIQLGFIGGLDQVKAIDAKYGVGAGKLIPATMDELEQYGSELQGLNASGDTKEVVAVKLELIEMQKSLLEYSENVSQIDFDAPNCSVSGSIVKARNAAEKAVHNADNALQKRNNLSKNISGFGYLIHEDFDTTLNAVKSSLEGPINTLKTIC